MEAEGDYARLHAASGTHLVRIPLSTLEDRWRNRGFQRVHRSYLVALNMVTGLRTSGASTMVRLRRQRRVAGRSSCRSAAARPANCATG